MKAKTRKAVSKRIKTTKGGKGKFMKDKAARNHLLVNKSKRAKKAGKTNIFAGLKSVIKKMLPNKK